MPRGPKGEHRPADVIGAAVRVARIATGEEGEVLPSSAPQFVDIGRKGGKARAQKLSPEQRSEIARKAAKSKSTARLVPVEEE